MNNTNENNWITEDDSSFDIREILSFVWRLKYWIIASLVVTISIAYVYLKVTIPYYTSSSTVMFSDKQSAGSEEMAVLSELTGKEQKNNITKEIYILRSPILMTKIVEELNLNTRYYQYKKPLFHTTFSNILQGLGNYFNIKDVEYYKDTPFVVTIPLESMPKPLPNSIHVRFDVNDNGYTISEFHINGESVKVSNETINFGDMVEESGFKFSINPIAHTIVTDNNEFGFSWQSPNSRALEIIGNLSVDPNGGGSDVLTLTQRDNVPQRAIDILERLVIRYNEQDRATKSESSISTVAFIDNRLQGIAEELQKVELSMKDYKSSKDIINLESQVQQTLSTGSQYENELAELTMQQKLLDMLLSNIDENIAGEFNLISANTGIADDGINTSITQYNLLVAERKKMLSLSSETNQRVMQLSEQLLDISTSIKQSAISMKGILTFREKELKSTISKTKSKLASVPTQQFDIAQISRQQQIIEPLYLLLQQKREEAQLAVYTATDNLRPMQETYSINQVEPKSKYIYILAILLGVGFAPAAVMLRLFFRTKVETKKDITKVLSVPILATIPKGSKIAEENIFQPRSRSVLSESFRILSSNIQFYNTPLQSDH